MRRRALRSFFFSDHFLESVCFLKVYVGICSVVGKDCGMDEAKDWAIKE